MQNHIRVHLNKICICIITFISLVFSKDISDSVFIDMCFLGKEKIGFMNGNDSDFSYLVVSKVYANSGISINEISDDYSSEITYQLNATEESRPVTILTDDGTFCQSLQNKKWVTKPCKRSTPHKINFFHKFAFEFTKLDDVKKQHLFRKKFPIIWEYRFRNGNQDYSISGNNNIFITGFCNKEQLNVITKRLKKSN